MKTRSTKPKCRIIGGIKGWILLTTVVAVPKKSFAALSWTNPRIDVVTECEAKEATAVFRFKNIGDTPVTIVQVKPSCGCTAVKLKKSTYVPGESGEITAISTIEGSVGAQEKSLTVTTSDAKNKPVTLGMHITIPELFTINNRLLIWSINEEPVERMASISCLKEWIRIEVAPEMPSSAICRIEPTAEGKTYQIAVRPKTTSMPANIRIPLLARLADNTQRSIVLFVLVR